jgi:hypothetical protein
MGAAIALAFCPAYPQRTPAAILTRPAWLNRRNRPPGVFPDRAMIQDAGVGQARGYSNSPASTKSG